MNDHINQAISYLIDIEALARAQALLVAAEEGSPNCGKALHQVGRIADIIGEWAASAIGAAEGVSGVNIVADRKAVRHE